MFEICGRAVGEKKVLHGHFASGEGTGLVESKGVDAGEGFDGIEILDEDFAATKADGGEGEDTTSEENKPLRYHVDKSGDSAGDGIGGAGFGVEARPEKQSADWDEGVANVFDDVVHEFKKFAVGSLDRGSLGLELGDKIIGANIFDSGSSSAGNYERARDELVAGVFFNIVLLAGDKGFVNLYGSVLYYTVIQDLIAEGENEDVVFFNLVWFDLVSATAAFDNGVFCGENAKFVDDFLGAEVVNNADEGVCDGNENKEHVFVTTDRDDHERQNQVHEVEKGESMAGDDFPGGVASHEDIIA